MSILHFSLLRALSQCRPPPIFSQPVHNLPCQVINDINIETILPRWYPRWLFWPYLSLWKPLSGGFAVDTPGHLDQHWLKQIVLWKQQGQNIRERIYPPLVCTHLALRVCVSTHTQTRTDRCVCLMHQIRHWVIWLCQRWWQSSATGSGALQGEKRKRSSN